MDYQNKIKELIGNRDKNAFVKWIKQHSELEQVNILKLYQEMSVQEMIDNDDYEMANNLSVFDEKIEHFLNAILDKKLLEEEIKNHLNQKEIMKQDLIVKTFAFRGYIIDCIVSNADNADEMRELANEIIKFEKENGIFEPEKWSVIF